MQFLPDILPESLPVRWSSRASLHEQIGAMREFPCDSGASNAFRRGADAVAVFAGDIAGIIAAVAANFQEIIERAGGIIDFSSLLWLSGERSMLISRSTHGMRNEGVMLHTVSP